MYSKQDIQCISRQIRKRIAVFSLPSMFLLASIVYSFTQRNQSVTILSSIALCFFLIFIWGLFLSPLFRYKRFLTYMLYGKSRTTDGFFKCFLPDISERDGVLFHALYINIGNSDNEEDDRLFYWDARLALPDWDKGDHLSVVSHDKAIIRWNRI